MKKGLGWIALIVLSVFVLAACGPQKATLTVNMEEYKFTPSSLEVPAGAEVTLNLTNMGTLEHEMVIMVFGKEATPPFDDDDEPNIFWEAEVEAGEEGVFTFTAPTEPGVYQVVCGIPAHIEQGMVASLTVK